MEGTRLWKWVGCDVLSEHDAQMVNNTTSFRHFSSFITAVATVPCSKCLRISYLTTSKYPSVARSEKPFTILRVASPLTASRWLWCQYQA